MSANREAIERIRDQVPKPSDAEALAQMFESSWIKDDGTVAGRLTAILDATEKSLVPGLQTGIEFHDEGFRKEFKDPWPSSDNQVGHFLTAVGLGFNPAKVEETVMGRSLRDWIGAPKKMSSTEVALRLIIGHEKGPDPGLGTAFWGWFEGGVGGAAGAVLEAFRAQFAAATDADVQVFISAEQNLGTGSPLDLASASSTLSGIRVDSTLRGNSYQDLLLSLYGWRLGQWINYSGRKYATKTGVAAWIRTNLM